MNPYILPPSMGKIVRQTGLFNLVKFLNAILGQLKRAYVMESFGKRISPILRIGKGIVT